MKILYKEWKCCIVTKILRYKTIFPRTDRNRLPVSIMFLRVTRVYCVLIAAIFEKEVQKKESEVTNYVR